MPLVHVRHQIQSGPTAFHITIHIADIGEKKREPLTFNCPTFKQCIPLYATRRLAPDNLEVVFESVRIHKHCILFKGIAWTVKFSSTGIYANLPVFGQPVFGLYHKYKETGWMKVDTQRANECYLS